MVFIKKTNNADSGDADHVGGDDWDKLDNYFDDIDIESTLGHPSKINTKTEVRSGKLVIKNPANTAGYTLRGGAISSNVNVDLPTSASDITLVASGGSNDWGAAMQTFRSSNISFRNPANTASYIHVMAAITANRNINWPLLTADDTPVFNNFAATLASKTVHIDTNTIKHSTTNAEGDLLVYDTTSGKYIRLARGSDGQVLKTVSGDLAWAAESGGSPAEDIMYTNLKSSSGFKYGLWNGQISDSQTPTGDYGLFSWIENIGGTAAAYIDSTNGFTGTSWAMTSGTANVGWRTTNAVTIRKLNPDLSVCFQLDEGGDNTGSRVWIGFCPSISSGSFNVDNLLNNRSGVMLSKESTETFFKITNNDGDATQDESASILTTDSNVHIIRIFATEASTKWSWQLDGGTINDLTLEIPTTTDNLAVAINASQSDSASRNFRVFWAKLKMKERA